MHGHEPHGIHLQCRVRHLAQIPLFREQNQIADAIEQCLHRRACRHGALVAQEIEELPYRDRPHAVADARAGRHLADEIGAVEEEGRRHVPGRR